MKTKLTIGCLGAIIILILVSFTNVVGVQSTTSGPVNESPLFSFRTQNAINKKSETILTSDYLGKGINALSFPLRDNNEGIQKVIERIRTMDDSTFKRFVSNVVNQIKHKDSLKDINIKEFIDGLHQLRESKQNIFIYKDVNDDKRTWFRPNFYPTSCWIPGCIILSIIILIWIFFNWGTVFTSPGCPINHF